MAHDINKKIAQWCQHGTRRILEVGNLYYHFQQKIAYIRYMTVPLCFYSTISAETSYYHHHHVYLFIRT